MPAVERSRQRPHAWCLRAEHRFPVSHAAWFLCGLWLALTAGCSAAAPASQFPSARAAIDRMRELHDCSRALKGEAKLDYFDDQGRIRVKTLFLSHHPKSVRFDLISPFGSAVATLTSDGQRFALLDQKERTFYVGDAEQCNVERFLRVPIPPEALVQLLAGEAPILLHQPGASSITWEDGRYVVRIQGKHQASQTIAFELVEQDRDRPFAEQRLRVTQVSVEQMGVVLYEAELSDHQTTPMASPRLDPDRIEAPVNPSGPLCHAEVPRRIRFVVPISERDVVFEHRELEHNPPLIPGVFEQQRPPGTVLRSSQCP